MVTSRVGGQESSAEFPGVCPRPDGQSGRGRIALSIVVTVVDGGRALQACLHALYVQDTAEPLEVLVPFDATIAEVGQLAERFPGVRWLDLGHVRTQRPAHTQAGQHELFDRRRSAGLAAACGEKVAILEDRGIPRSDWARAALAIHAAKPNAVVGGAVENGVDRPLNWAVYFCDFGRYQLPLEHGPAAYATDVNVVYKREALDRTREHWKERYHETTVHWALQRAGETILLSPEPVVEQVRRKLRLSAVLVERYHWGRLFAYTRAREASNARRLCFAAGAPVLPFLLLARVVRDRIRRRAQVGLALRVMPLILLLQAAWCAGEFVGYATRRP